MRKWGWTILYAALFAAPLLISLLAIQFLLPDEITIHWNRRGHADASGSKHTIIVLPIIILLTGVLMEFLPRFNKEYASIKIPLDRLKFGVGIFFNIMFLIMFFNVLYGLHEKGTPMHGISLIPAAIGLLFAYIGYLLPHFKPNNVCGIRVKWTMNDPVNWEKTHKLAGKIWIAGGLILCIGALTIPLSFHAFLLISTIVVLVAIPLIYSYRLSLRS